MERADLKLVLYMLRQERMEEKFRLLRAGSLLPDLRSAVSVVNTGAAVSKEASLRLKFAGQSLVAGLREVLEAVLNMQEEGAEEWHQVPAVLYRYLVFRSNTLRDLRQFLDKFRSLVPYVEQKHGSELIRYGENSSTSYGIDVRARSRNDIGEPMVGRSELLEKMVNMLLADRTGDNRLFVMSIAGGPGVGKSRLAKAILNDDRVKHKFLVRLVVPVTRDFRRRRIHMKMVSPKRHADIQTSPKALAGLINTELNGGDYLIVLDDVWSDYDEKWQEIGAVMAALPSNGRVVLTTRTPDVTSKLATVVEIARAKPFYLQPLGPEFSSWFVSRWITTYCGDWPGQLIGAAGMKVAEKCGGVPLLLNYARQIFCQPLGLQFWQRFIENTGNEIHPDMFWLQLLAYIDQLPSDKFWLRFLQHCSKLPDGDVVLESASVSYEHLLFDMRQCFSYCSMFPADYDFDIEELADLLAAAGYIPAIVARAQRKGFLGQLLQECFYPLQEHEYGEKITYRLHKVLHIYAQYKSRGTNSVFRVDQATQLAPKIADQNRTTQHASLIVSPFTSSFPRTLFACNNLRALILLQDGAMCSPDHPRCEITEIPREFGQSFWTMHALSFRATKIKMLPTKVLEPNNVKYLNLSQTDIKNIPSSISRLLSIETLILSYCDKLQTVHPNISKLTQLQKLDLEGCCNLVDLPREMNKMKSLKYLNFIECSSLIQLPTGIGQLKNLQMLLGYIVPDADGSSMSELKWMADLHRLSLHSLEKVSDLLDVKSASLQHRTRLESLSLWWNMDASSIATPAYAVIESLQPHSRLKALEIVAYQGKRLPSWISTNEPYLKSLVEIKLINLRSCEKVLPALGLLPCLKIAEISGAENICCVDDHFYGHNGTFPSLEILTFSYMHNLEVWEQASRPGMFPCLTKLVIIQCPKLRALHMELPSVEKLVLWMGNKVLYGPNRSLQGVARNLEHISISFSEELLASSDCEGLQDLGKLTKLEICECSEMTHLPKNLQYLSTIRSLAIDNCRKLEVLPDWLENFPSLQIMRLSSCPVLHHIPGGLQQRPGITIYMEDCPNLVEKQFPNF